MDSKAALVYGATLATAIVSAIGFAIAWYRANRRLHALEEQVLPAHAPSEAVADLERIVQDLAAQVDQLANGQEFLNRIVSDKLGQLPAPRREDANRVTPH